MRVGCWESKGGGDRWRLDAMNVREKMKEEMGEGWMLRE